PEEMRATQFNRALQHTIKTEEDGNLEEQRQTATERADLVFLHELHGLLVHLARIVLVLLLNRFHLRLKRRHALHRPSARLRQRPEDEFDNDGDDDDREAVRNSNCGETVHREEKCFREKTEKTIETHHTIDIAGQF